MSPTIDSVKAELDQLRAEFNEARATALAYIASHQSPAPPAPEPSDDPNDPALFVMPDVSLTTDDGRDALIRLASRLCNHTAATPAQMDYWRGVWPGLVARGEELGMPDYAWKKLIGWQSTGGDKPHYGPYR